MGLLITTPKTQGLQCQGLAAFLKQCLFFFFFLPSETTAENLTISELEGLLEETEKF